MNKKMMVVLGSGVGLSLGAALLAGEALAGPQEDLAAIDAVRAMEAASINEGDSAVLAKIYAADAESVPPGEPAVQGVDALAAWLDAMIADYEVNLEYTASDVKLLGDWAVEQYAGSVVMTPRAGGDVVAEAVRGVHVYQRDADGNWKIAHDIWNYYVPGAEE